jgi:hypothetical protein
MIDDPTPADWKELQKGVCRIFRNIGLYANVEVDLETPRGSVNVDVLAIDGRSVDKIKYIVECKNWNHPIPQHVVHSFTTVMHETGANIGFIISKVGLQAGAKQYTESTNISGFTYLEFQQRYFTAWWKRYFCPRIGDAADRVLQYVEPVNRRRDEEYAKLLQADKEKFDQIRLLDSGTVMILSMFNNHIVSPILDTGTLLNTPVNLEIFKSEVLAKIAPHVEWHCHTFRGLLEIMLQYLRDVEEEFNQLFGSYIFNIEPISKVTQEGPPLEDY